MSKNGATLLPVTLTGVNRLAKLFSTYVKGIAINNNNNNKQICIAPSGHNFRGAGARQRVSEQRKKRKPGRRGMSLA